MSTIVCLYCSEDVQGNSRGYWWHSDTGHVQCELYATPQMILYSEGDMK